MSLRIEQRHRIRQGRLRAIRHGADGTAILEEAPNKRIRNASAQGGENVVFTGGSQSQINKAV